MKTSSYLLAAITIMITPLAFADVTVVIPTNNDTDQTTTTSETYVDPAATPYVGAVVPVGGAAAVYGRDLNGVNNVNGVGHPGQFNNEFDHKAGAAGFHERQNGAGRTEGRGMGGERGGRR